MIVRMILLLTGMVAASAGAGLAPAIRLSGENRKRIILWAPVCGAVCLWAVFQLVSVPFILKQADFSGVVTAYGVSAAIWILLNIISAFFCRNREDRNISPDGEKRTGAEIAAWILFWGLLLLQLLMSIFFAFADGDDAYYVGTASVTESSNTMYRIIPYTGVTTELDVRHCLAPFPVWIAVLSRISGCPADAVSHVVMPLFVILLVYPIYALLGGCLFRERKQFVCFMIFMEILVLWGNYSFYTGETFVLTRSSQGKAIVAGIVIPFLFLILFLIGERAAGREKTEWILWILLGAGVIASCLCTTLGSFFSCTLIGISGICMAVAHKKFKILIPLFLCCVPALLYLGIFMILQ